MRKLVMLSAVLALGLLQGCGGSCGCQGDGAITPAPSPDGAGQAGDSPAAVDAPAVPPDGAAVVADSAQAADRAAVADAPALRADSPQGTDGAIARDSGDGGDGGDGGGARDGGRGDGGAADVIPVNLDPAAGFNTPGAYTTPLVCPACPVASDTAFEVNAGTVTSLPLQGQVTGATGNGTFFVQSAPDAQGHTQQISGPIPTTNGSYTVTVPLFCGSQTIKEVWSNASGTTVVVKHVTTSGCVQTDIRVTISWDALGRDWELHLIKPGGRINNPLTDCTWTTCVGTQPDWGVLGDSTDNPSKDVDNTGAYGPENIYLSKPETGRYTVMVEHWGSGGMPSSGQAILNVRGAVYVFNITNFASHWVWTVATIDWPSATVTAVGTLYDCTANWSGGCLAAIP